MLENIKNENKIKGDIGENIVNNYILKSGYQILYRNFRCSSGEIDIIFQDKDEIVFCEIKTRTGIKYGFPAESVTYMKRKHILNTAKYFLYKTGVIDIPVRFDVIEVYLYKNKKPIINHIKNVFW